MGGFVTPVGAIQICVDGDIQKRRLTQQV